MEQNLLTKKKLKEKSIEYQIPFADLLEVFLQETLMFQILETDFAKRLWLKDREDFSIDGYRKEWQKPLYLLYRKFLKSSEIVYNRLEIKNDITKERRGLRHDVVYEVFCFGLG